jgi:hypothetical protein
MVNGRASRACAYGRGSVATMVKSAGYVPAHRSMANPNVAVFLLRVRQLHHLSRTGSAGDFADGDLVPMADTCSLVSAAG